MRETEREVGKESVWIKRASVIQEFKFEKEGVWEQLSRRQSMLCVKRSRCEIEMLRMTLQASKSEWDR
jgi:hypothetical protein